MTTIKKLDIALTGKEDWDDWVQAVGGSLPAGIWKAINPYNRTTTLLEQPQKPVPHDFNDNAKVYLDLSEQEQQAYRIQTEIWKEESRSYKEQQKDVEHAYSFIYHNVSTVLQASLDRSHPLPQWIDKLRNAAEPADGFMITKMKTEYQEILRSFKGTRNLTAWLDKWETLMVKASRYNISDIDGGLWLLDLANLIDPIHQTYATTFREAARSITQDKKRLDDKKARLVSLAAAIQVGISSDYTSEERDRFAEMGNLAREIQREDQAFNPVGFGDWTAGKVAGKLKEWAKDQRNRSNQATSSGTQRGTVFYAADGFDEEKVLRPGTGSNKRPRSDEQQGSYRSKKPSHGCPACEMPSHSLENCWSAIPEIQPSDARPNRYRIGLVEKSLANDPALRARVEGLRLAAREDQTRLTEVTRPAAAANTSC